MIIRNNLFFIALPTCALVAIFGLVYPEFLATTSAMILSTAFRALDWFFLGLATVLLILALWLAFSRFGKLKLGHPNDQPEFSIPSWLAMLFAAGMGVGLLFWGVAEPITHLTDAPGFEPGSPAAARQSMVISIFHWGLHAWAVYGVAALVLAYFGFRHGTPYLPGSPIRRAMSGFWVEPMAWLADFLATVAVALGVAGSIGLGVFQMQSGLYVLAGFSLDSTMVPIGILTILILFYLPPLATDLDKGVKWLSNANMILALIVMFYILFAGPTAFLLRTFQTALGDYIAGVTQLSFQLFPFADARPWLKNWTFTYWLWWIAWAPFVGVFIARISRGRTIREFVIGVIGVPAMFSILWFSIFGGTGLYEEIHGMGGIEGLVKENISIALFSLFDRLPMSDVLNGIALVLSFVFLVTSIVSASYVLGMFTSQGALNPSVGQKLAWGVALGALGAALTFSGNVEAVRTIAFLGAIPFAFILLLQVAALLRVLLNEPQDKESL
jgi:glycine betaine transporter